MRIKSKNIYLIIGITLLYILAYKYAIFNTIHTKVKLEQIRSRTQDEIFTPEQHQQIITKNNKMDSILNNNKVKEGSVQNNLLSTLNNYRNDFNFKIIEFNQPHILTLPDSSQISTYHFKLEGEYKELEATLYNMESLHSFGSINSLKFEKQKDFKYNQDFLQVSVYIKNIKSLK